MPRWRQALVVVVLVLCAVAAWATPPEPLKLRPAARGQAVGAALWHWVDPGGHAGLEQAQAAFTQGQFRPVPRGLRLQNPDQAVWLRLELEQAEHAGDWLLSLQTTAIEDVDFHGPFNAQGQAEQAPVHTGLARPYAPRPLGLERPAMRLRLHDAGRYSVYIRLRADTSQSVGLSAWETVSYLQWRQHKRLFDGMVYGVLLALLLYNIALFYVLRDRSYGFYVLTGLAALFTLASFNGHAAHYLVGDWPWLQQRANALGAASWVAMATLFCRSFLDTRQRLPRWDRLLLAVVGIGLLALGLALAGQTYWAHRLVEWGASGGAVAAAWGALLAWRGGFRPAAWYLAGQLLLFLSTLVVVAENWGLYVPGFVTTNALQTGVVAEMVVFAFALSARIRVMRERQSELSRRASALAEAAATDALTGLANRVGLSQQAQRVLSQSGHCALMLLDLDRFKPINDEHGHEAGDRVLVEVARRLHQLMREGDGVARLGGDEFVVLLAGPHSPDRLATVAQRLAEAVRQPVMYRDQPLSVGVSIGIARCPEQGQTLTELMRHADQAMYRAKQAGSDHAFYDRSARA